MAPKNRHIKRARPLDLWVTKEGFVVQVQSMTDLHLLNTFMKLLNAARQTMFKRLQRVQPSSHGEDVNAERIFNGMTPSGFAYVMDLERTFSKDDEPVSELLLAAGLPIMRVMFDELKFRGILSRMPETL